MKIKHKKLESKIKNKYLDILYTAIEYAKTKNEIKSFISDILTESEKVMLGRRIQIAKKLLRKMSYPQIAREEGVGFDTIYKVKKWLGGRHGGYEKIAEKIRSSVKIKPKSGFKDYYPSGGLSDIKKRYRSYYWLSDLLEEINKDSK